MKIFLEMVGCRLNQSELELFARQFRLAGHSLTPDIEFADLIVINTCTVTAAAASDSRHKIRQAARAGSNQIIVTGCYATLNPNEISKLSGDIQVIGNQEKDRLVSTVLNIPAGEFSQSTIERQPIPGARLRTRAFIKVQDGCDNHCTYCITRLARGPSRSCTIASILADIQSAVDGGTNEIVLTGVHLGSWGNDFEPPTHLLNLVNSIISETQIQRLRLSSIEPWDISPEFFELWQNPRICRHIHLPLQSGCNATLRRMGRRITPDAFANLVQQARASISGIAITTDIITGFPGETEAEFSESLEFVKEMNFTNGHVFTYSARPGTVAASLPDQVPHAISKQRNARIREILLKSSLTYQEKYLGHDLQVLWEKVTPADGALWMLSGLTDNYLRVSAKSTSPCHNQIMNVHITGIDRGELVGEISPIQSRYAHSQDTL
jgi:threonylcarbamoyladenosine tRNA methylthiotransferase MtaB